MSEEEIRKSAYSRWEAEGRPEGQQERHWREAQNEFKSGGSMPETWSSDHGGAVSPPTRIGRQGGDPAVEEPSNDWPAAGEDGDPTVMGTEPVESFDPPKSEDGRRLFQNGDTDRDG